MQSREKLMERWSPEALRFMADASDYGDFHKKLAEKLKDFLPPDGEICDAGCGLGHLAYELSYYCRQVTAVDCAQAPIFYMTSNLCRDNLLPLCADISTVEKQFDAMVFCYFGRIEEILRLAKKLCRGTVIVVRRNCSEHRFSVGQVTRKSYSTFNAKEQLASLGIPYYQERFSLELGQPFRSLEDAAKFFELYNKSDEAVKLDLVLPRLQKIQHPIFSYYLQEKRKMELLVFRAKDVR